ncbi:carbohydrate-binding domain-containing protein [Salinimicrobium sp. TIG7-5_MAKvit]|uniref:carbohydrate-binding domain-containing protein n=1 Tax=Salinimicrobium sp. TIG7-5_MAKvit TaxID=3121289 RepID=UPI003C6E7792
MKTLNEIPLLILGLTMLFLVGCSTDDSITDEAESESRQATEEDGLTHEASEDYVWDDATVIDIVLNGTSITTSDDVVTIDGTTATLTAAATYRVTGDLEDGQLIVDTENNDAVQILLNGVEINNKSGSAFNIINAEKTIIIVLDGTTNYLADASYYLDSGDTESDAALYSNDDLTIYGGGTLVVQGNSNEAIKSNAGLILKEANIEVTSIENGIEAKDFLLVKDGSYKISAGGDAFKSSNDAITSVGYITIESGNFIIISGEDGLQAESKLSIAGANLNITSGGGSSALLGENSSKGVKGGTGVTIETGAILNIDAADDGIHSKEQVTINGGAIHITSGDDAIHSDENLEINDGEIVISGSVEGIEGAEISINGGNIHVVSSDDAVNAAGDADGSNYYLYINAGYLVIDSEGDGIDVNGVLEMTDGVVIVNGPTSSGNGAIDYDRQFNISGGFLLAVGSSGMAQAPSNSSNQNSVLVKLNSGREANTLIHLENSDGTSLFTFMPAKAFQSVVFSSPQLKTGESYNLYLGGSSSGTATDGLYNEGNYTSGSLYKEFSLSSTVTTLN